MKKRHKYLIEVAAALLLCGGCRGISPPEGVAASDDRVVTTGYCECGECCSWHRTWYGMPVYSTVSGKSVRKHVGITASGTRVHRGTIAADISLYPYGTVMYIPGYGYGRVEDRGGKVTGNHIDLYFPSHGEAQRWGRHIKAVKVWRLPKPVTNSVPPRSSSVSK